MTGKHLCYALFATVCIVGCSDISQTASPQLDVTPAEVVFAKPDPGTNSRRMTVELKNVGNAMLKIASIDLEESDEIKELSVLDADDWQMVRDIEPDSAEYVTIGWRALDAAADRGRLIINHNGGPPVVVPIRTADIDPCIGVTTEPVGIEGDGETSVTLDQAIPGGFQKLRIEISSTCIAALNIDAIELLTAEGESAEANTLGPYTLCSGEAPSPANCLIPEPPAALGFEGSVVYSAFYAPPVGQAGVQPGRIMITSNDAINPRYEIKIRGRACVRRMPGDVCNGCGNGEVNSGEQCDDGNLIDDDDCRNNCTNASCGDGLTQPGEQCDDANAIDTDACRNDCTAARCGDGVVQTDVEQCDDGNQDDTDACRNDCTPARCGDGIVQAGVEACDDGNDIQSDACLTDCTMNLCGDGHVLDGVEACDDGNADNTDACLNTCLVPAKILPL